MRNKLSGRGPSGLQDQTGLLCFCVPEPCRLLQAVLLLAVRVLVEKEGGFLHRWDRSLPADPKHDGCCSHLWLGPCLPLGL